MRVGVVGGGPAGLFFALLTKLASPGWRVAVCERMPSSRAGFGLVLPSRTLDSLMQWDPVLGCALRRVSTEWDKVNVVHRGNVVSTVGRGYRALSRDDLLRALHRRLGEIGVRVSPVDVRSPASLAAENDVLVGADGTRSAVRCQWADQFGPRLRLGRCRYLWARFAVPMATFNFHIVESDHGVMCLHAYPYGDKFSTVIVEMRDEVWRGYYDADPERKLPDALPAVLERTLCETLGGKRIDIDGPGWQRFTTVHNDRWVASNVVLIGDAAHAAHFSVGSGTKLAIEDARTLVECLVEEPSLKGLGKYETRRRPAVSALQDAASASQLWFEELATHVCDDPVTLAERLFRRSGRVSDAVLELQRSAQA